MYYGCNTYGWNPPYPYNEYYDRGYVAANSKCVNLPKNVQLCYNAGLRPTATLTVNGKVIATGVVNPLQKTVILKGSAGDITANITIKVTSVTEHCGNVSGSICKSGKCQNLNYTNICFKSS